MATRLAALRRNDVDSVGNSGLGVLDGGHHADDFRACPVEALDQVWLGNPKTRREHGDLLLDHDLQRGVHEVRRWWWTSEGQGQVETRAEVVENRL
ncbi:MAG: hypothetical protein OEV40_16510 [Acidimicrobiia bacterium]|nr:hypothetical protein [Acidimicrobiia bacterium]